MNEEYRSTAIISIAEQTEDTDILSRLIVLAEDLSDKQYRSKAIASITERTENILILKEVLAIRNNMFKKFEKTETLVTLATQEVQENDSFLMSSRIEKEDDGDELFWYEKDQLDYIVSTITEKSSDEQLEDAIASVSSFSYNNNISKALEVIVPQIKSVLLLEKTIGIVSSKYHIDMLIFVEVIKAISVKSEDSVLIDTILSVLDTSINETIKLDIMKIIVSNIENTYILTKVFIMLTNIPSASKSNLLVTLKNKIPALKSLYFQQMLHTDIKVLETIDTISNFSPDTVRHYFTEESNSKHIELEDIWPDEDVPF